jgi:NTE family protein
MSIVRPAWLKRPLRLRRLLPRRAARPQPLNLALQGGGAHGAFTWGVLDRMLDSPDIGIAGVSGTSAGAINAVALAAGFVEGGADGARARLESVWRAISAARGILPAGRNLASVGATTGADTESTAMRMMRLMTGLFSPYELNPLEIDPLRDILAAQIDFRALARSAPMALFVNATEVATGRGRVFSGSEITLDAVLASVCLPSLRHAVKIGRQHYWDGAFSANPALLPLIEHCATDTLIVLLLPERTRELPTKAHEIQHSLGRIMVSQPLLKEIEAIETFRRLAHGGFGRADTMGRRLKRHRFHLIEAGRTTGALGPASALSPDWELLVHLREAGRKAAAGWLGRNREAVGRRSTIDLGERFL